MAERLVIEIDADLLSGLNRSFRQVEQHLGKLTKGVKRFNRDSEKGAKRFADRLKDVESRLRTTADRLDRTSQGLRRFGMAMTVGVAAPIGLAVRAAGKFQDRLKYANTMVKMGEGELRKFGERLREQTRAMDYSRSSTDRAAASYEVFSRITKDQEQALAALKDANIAAVGGQMELAESVVAGSRVFNALKGQLKTLGGAYDWMFAIVQEGGTTFRELAQTIGNVTGAVKAAKIGVDEFGGATALLTNIMPTSIALQSLWAVLRDIRNETPKATKAAKALGIEWGQTALQTKGLIGTLRQLEGVDSTKIANLFQAESMRAVDELMVNMDEWAKKTQAVSEYAGASAAAAKEMADSWGEQTQRMKNMFAEIGVSVGQKILPQLNEGMEKLRDNIKEMEDSGELEESGDSLGKALEKIGDRMPTVMRHLKGLADWFSNLNPKVQEFLLLATLLAAPLATLAGAFLGLVGVMGRFTAAIIAVSSAIVTRFGGAKKVLGNFGAWLALRAEVWGPYVRNAVGAIGRALMTLPGAVVAVGPGLDAAWSALLDIVPAKWNVALRKVQRSWQEWGYKLDAWIIGLGRRLREGGESLIRQFDQGVKSAFKVVSGTVRRNLQKIRDMFPGSEPKDATSPLYGLTKAGEAIGENLAAGMRKSKAAVRQAAMELAAAAGVPFGTVQARKTAVGAIVPHEGALVETGLGLPTPGTPGRDLGLGQKVFKRPTPQRGRGLGLPSFRFPGIPRPRVSMPELGAVISGRREKAAESMRWLNRELDQMSDRFANNFARAISGRRRDFGDLFRRAGQDLKEMLARAVYEATIGDTMRSVLGQFGKLLKRAFGGKKSGLLGGGEIFGKNIMPAGNMNLSLPALAMTAGMTIGGTAGKVLGGASLGFMVGGPVGALVGGLIGGLFHDSANDRSAKQSGRDLARHFLSGVEDQQRRTGSFTMVPAVARRDDARLAKLLAKEIQSAQPPTPGTIRAHASTRLTLGTRDLEETIHDLHFLPSVV